MSSFTAFKEVVDAVSCSSSCASFKSGIKIYCVYFSIKVKILLAKEDERFSDFRQNLYKRTILIFFINKMSLFD